MVTCCLDTLKKYLKRKEMRIKKEKVEELQQTIYSRQKRDRKVKDWDDKILGFDFVFSG